MWFMRKFDSIILTYTLESDQNIDVLFEQMIPISICLLAGLKREGGGAEAQGANTHWARESEKKETYVEHALVAPKRQFSGFKIE